LDPKLSIDRDFDRIDRGGQARRTDPDALDGVGDDRHMACLA
jgi:hypothetical protein